MRAVLKARINKTDRNDARGIAQMMRAELYRPIHVKTLRSQKLRMLYQVRPEHVGPASGRRRRLNVQEFEGTLNLPDHVDGSPRSAAGSLTTDTHR
jgi:hypothetical protein